MLTLLQGPDDYSKRQYVANLEQTLKLKADFFVDAETPPVMNDLAGADLFAKTKIYALKNMISLFNNEVNIASLLASKNQIIFIEEKLDKRSSDNKKLLANKAVQIKEFLLPHGREVDAWLIKRSHALGTKLSARTADVLAVALGRDNAKETKVGGKVVAVQEVYNLWQAENELQKLVSHAGGREITEADVNSLANLNEEVDAFELTNAIADGNKQKALYLMDRFLRQQSGGEEKGAVIQLNALLAEQFRSVAIIQDLLAQKKSEAEILEILTWKPGRLFIMSKVATRFSKQSVLGLLTKLKALDEELKTGSVPPRVLLDLIITQLWKE
ncbi:MAG: hypothetical protein WC794_04795 [Candidatus Doudnabacteria bacterium]|jgi:DNA polymerase III delta subunit